MKKPYECKNCGSRNLIWKAGIANNGTCQDGQISMHDITVIFYLGCEECSETCLVVSGDDIAKELNKG